MVVLVLFCWVQLRFVNLCNNCYGIEYMRSDFVRFKVMCVDRWLCCFYVIGCYLIFIVSIDVDRVLTNF